MKGLDRHAGLISETPSPEDLRGITPCGLQPIKVTPLDKPITSFAIMDKVRALGMSADEIGLSLFRSSKFGKPRRIDNLDLITGYPFYGREAEGLSNLRSTLSDISSFRDDFMKALPNPIIYDMEDQDFKKISILRPVYTGRHLQPPIALDFVRASIPPDFKAILQKVVKRYSSASTYMKTGKAAILDGTDAKDTALGSPTFYVGDEYHAARLATMECIPTPDYTLPPGAYISELEHFASFFPDPSVVYASYLSYRQGATNKSVPLFANTGLGFEAKTEAAGLYTRQRAVWAAPFYLNVLLTPLVLRMKSSRQHILGMWHAPQQESVYVSRLQSQGKTAIEIDYSGFDTTISNELMVLVYRELAANGYSPWESTLMAELTQLQGAITPSFTGMTDSVTYFRHNVTLMSGLLTTSELGSIVSISIVLYCLSKQHPHLLEAWLNGQFIILVQSDDVLFTTDLNIDIDRFKIDASRIGIAAKVQEGSTFLKRFLPVGKFNKLAKPFSRNVQQTIGNEDSYDGKPDAILRLGLAARCTSLNGHPLYSSFFPRLFEIYESHFDYVKGIEDKKGWIGGDFTITQSDVRAIEQYAASSAGANLLTNLLERAAFDPSAATVVAYLKARGLDLVFLMADQVTARRAYAEALFSPPKPDSLSTLLSYSRWNT